MKHRHFHPGVILSGAPAVVFPRLEDSGRARSRRTPIDGSAALQGRVRTGLTDERRGALGREPEGSLYLSVVIAVLGLFLLMSCTSEKRATIATPETVSGVALITAQRTTVPDYMEATGTVHAAQSAQLASQVMGTITRVSVHEGDGVRRGQVLIAIDEAQPHAAYQSAVAGLQASQQGIAAADADYSLAESTMQRYQLLFDKKSVSPHEYDEVKAKLAAAKARRDAAHANSAQAEAGVTEAKTTLGFTSIRAPFDGVITAKLVDAGAMAAPGVPLLVLEDPSHFRLEVTVDESQIGVVRLGASVPVVLDSLGSEPITGKVVQIVPAADPASRTFTVKIDLPSNAATGFPLRAGVQIRSGVYGRARFPRGERQAILVPQTALLHRGQLDAIYVVGNDQVASLRYVTLGKPEGGDVEVLSGLDIGERIVGSAADRELSGKRVVQ